MKHILTVLTVLVAALAAVAQQQDFGQMDFAALLQQADGGNAEAQYELGRCCLYGVGTTKNRENAKVLLEAAAKAGDKNAKKLYEEEFLNKVQEL